MKDNTVKRLKERYRGQCVPLADYRNQLFIGNHLLFMRDKPRALVGWDRRKDLPVHAFVDAMYWRAQRKVNGEFRFDYYVSPPTEATRDAICLLRGALSYDSDKIKVFENGDEVSTASPAFDNTPPITDWAEALQERHRLVLPDLAKKLKERVGDESFRWYRNVTCGFFSGRIEGLQVCKAFGDGRVVLEIGAADDARQQQLIDNEVNLSEERSTAGGVFRSTAGTGSIVCTTETLDRAIEVLCRLSHSRRCGALSTIYREHHLESRVLREDVPVFVGDQKVTPVFVGERLPFQFPTLWSPHGKPRFVDALMKTGSTPWVVELKVPGSEGQYYRHGITQAVLYREFIRRAVAFDPWFKAQGLDRTACQAAVAFPRFQNRGQRRERLARLHQEAADLFGVKIVELPAWYPKPRHPA